MSRIAFEFGATIDKFVGDAMLMFFGDPESHGVREDALRCVRMADLQAFWRVALRAAGSAICTLSVYCSSAPAMCCRGRTRSTAPNFTASFGMP